MGKSAQKIRFGTDGWRAKIGQDFNLKNVEAIAQALSDYLSSKVKGQRKASTVAVGYDTRRLSKEAARLISQVLAANRIKVILSDRALPTQAISYAVKAHGCPVGIVVTASHNPVHFNGIKIKGAFGGPVETRTTDKIEELIFKHRPNKISVSQAKKNRLLKIANLISPYLNFLRSYLDIPILKSARLNILVDSMHGVANSYIAMVLKDAPHKVTTIHKNYDFSFGGVKPEPIQSCLTETASVMRQGDFDLAVATDGDADRIAALDPQGRFVNPQQIISLLLLYLIQQRKLKGAVVKTISGTTLLDKIAKKYKLKLYETPIGFKHIAHLMQKKDILIGGEEAGGIGFKNYLPERDGILAALLLLEAIIVKGNSITALLQDMQKEFGSYFYLRTDIKCLDRNRTRVEAVLAKMRRRKTFFGKEISNIKDYDGLKFLLADGSWILFRLSGTEPILRIYAETDKLSKTKRLLAEGGKLVKF